jgi:hypothetical protein
MLEVSLRLAISMKVKAVEPLEVVLFLLLVLRTLILTESASSNKIVPNRFLLFGGHLSYGRGLPHTSTEFLKFAISISVPIPISLEPYDSLRADIA